MLARRDAYQAEVISLRDRIAHLEAENAQLRQSLTPVPHLPKSWGLYASERNMISSMLAAPDGFRTHDALRFIASRSGETSGTGLRVRIHRIRKRLAPHGIKIETIICEGYRLPKASREAIRVAIAADQ